MSENDKLTEREKAIMNEAFMMGRVYATMGEKESPGEIGQKLMMNCLLVAGAPDQTSDQIPRAHYDKLQNELNEANLEIEKLKLTNHCQGPATTRWGREMIAELIASTELLEVRSEMIAKRDAQFAELKNDERICTHMYESTCHGIELIMDPFGKEWSIGGTNRPERWTHDPWCGGRIVAVEDRPATLKDCLGHMKKGMEEEKVEIIPHVFLSQTEASDLFLMGDKNKKLQAKLDQERTANTVLRSEGDLLKILTARSQDEVARLLEAQCLGTKGMADKLKATSAVVLQQEKEIGVLEVFKRDRDRLKDALTMKEENLEQICKALSSTNAKNTKLAMELADARLTIKEMQMGER